MNVSILLHKWTGRLRKLDQDFMTDQTLSILYIFPKVQVCEWSGKEEQVRPAVCIAVTID